MAQGKKVLDGIDEVIDLFPPGSHKMIERLLARAAERDAKTAGRNVRAALRDAFGRGDRTTTKIAGVDGLATNLAKALRQRGDIGGGKASIRQTAPDTGGRPFHFAHSVVGKETSAPAASETASAVSKAAGHMLYIERERAVERTNGQEHDDVDELRGDRRYGRNDDDMGHENGRVVDEKGHPTSAQAGQGYIENAAKLTNGEQIVFSFGTIGDRFEDRVRFWEALEEAEAHPSARVQHRLIVELPHEASPQARHDMMRVFTKRFENDGIPYWAALHAPGKDNDSRNFHAHIVYSERPAKRMVDPVDPTGPEEWDFAIIKTYRKKSRNLVTSRPYRQEKLRSYHARGSIPALRREFSDAVNAVLVRDAVKDKKGEKVLYDARSYSSMGVETIPMRSINRIVADKMKDGQLTVLDGDYTRRMVAVEIREAAAERQKDVMDLLALDDVLRATGAASRPQERNAKLPPDLRISPWANPGQVALRAASRKILEARHAALQIDVMERATSASIERIIAATAPKAIAAATKSKDPIVKAEAASGDAAWMLHAAALDELAETKTSMAKARRSMAYRIGNAVNEWKALVQAKPPEISPAIKAAIRQMDRREEQAERAALRPQNAPRQEQTTASMAFERRPEPRGEEPASEADDRTATGSRRDAVATAVPEPRPGQVEREGIGATELREERTGQPTIDARQESADVRPSSPRTSAPQVPVGAWSSQAARTTYPMSMADALSIKMPPTNAALREASHQVSDWIKKVINGEDDVNVRITKLETFVDDLKADVRRRQRLPPLEGDALVRTSIRLEEFTATPTATPVVEVQPAEHNATFVPATGHLQSRAATPLSAREVTPVAARPNKIEIAADSEPEHDAHAGTVPDPPKEDGTLPAGEIVIDGTSMPEDPDDARRRKKREEEIEKRKRQRRAVLGRQNRGRGR